jgi:hypothetical protein
MKKEARVILSALGGTLNAIHADLKAIEADFPQLSEISRAKITINGCTFRFSYEKGLSWPTSGLQNGPILQKLGAGIIIEMNYPSKGECEAPLFSAAIEGNYLEGMAFIYAEPKAKSFKEKANEIIIARLEELGLGFNTKINFEAREFYH